MSSVFGKNISVQIFGESHGPVTGAVLEGLPAGIKIDMDLLYAFMAKRRPGGRLATPRKEKDLPEFVSGVFEGVTSGGPVTIIIKNKDVKSSDYEDIKYVPRPGHADFSAAVKYQGYHDYRGGGRFSGRLTAPLTAAGGVAKQVLKDLGINIGAELIEVGGIDAKETATVEKVISEAREEGDSVGGIIQCTVTGAPAGLGEPFFRKTDSLIAQAVMSIPSVKAVEIGAGIEAARFLGSKNNDQVHYGSNGQIKFESNNAGGILGGITTGAPVVFRAAFKPAPSISRRQQSINFKSGRNVQLEIKGRHDACPALRAVPVVEAAAALVILDLFMDEYSLKQKLSEVEK